MLFRWEGIWSCVNYAVVLNAMSLFMVGELASLSSSLDTNTLLISLLEASGKAAPLFYLLIARNSSV